MEVCGILCKFAAHGLMEAFASAFGATDRTDS